MTVELGLNGVAGQGKLLLHALASGQSKDRDGVRESHPFSQILHMRIWPIAREPLPVKRMDFSRKATRHSWRRQRLIFLFR